MYSSLKLPWSTNPSPAEVAYRDAGLVKTKGTVYLLPPGEVALRDAFKAPPRPKSRMSSGANALCKHFERGGASSEKGVAHSFWTLPTGSNDSKSAVAASILDKMLDNAVWKNVMMLHDGVAIYEIRNDFGYGMRWTLQLRQLHESGLDLKQAEIKSVAALGQEACPSAVGTGMPESWTIGAVLFRGFVEPIEGIEISKGGS